MDILNHAKMRQKFTANVSHELKTPLTAISGYVELIASGMTNEKDTAHFANEIPAQKNEVTLCIEGEPVPVSGNKALIEELFYNLCSNAIRYNKKGGVVTITTTIENGRPVLSVKDTGIGIPKEQQNRVFERFYRADKSRSKSTGGTGLGLAIVKHIVAQHDAQISLTSEEGVGTEVKVVLKKYCLQS